MADIWREFVSFMMNGAFPEEKILPLLPPLKETLVSFLRNMQKKADWNEWQTPTETFRVDAQVHYLLPLTFDGQKSTYCFSFVIRDNEWFFQQMEGITIRLDQVAKLPTSVFPDISEAQKAWIREETRVSKEIRLYKQFVEERGKAYASEWFRDGAGYLLAARVWVPFKRLDQAFILYLCWEQANLSGNPVILRRLEEREAEVEIEPIYLKLYHQTHLSLVIRWEDYTWLYEVIWQDRAKSAGWKLAIEYKENACIFRFYK